MTYFKDPIITFFCTISAACLMLLTWPPLAYVLLSLIVCYLIYNSIRFHARTLKFIGQFLAEFLGFGLVLLVFISLLLLMGVFFA